MDRHLCSMYFSELRPGFPRSVSDNVFHGTRNVAFTPPDAVCKRIPSFKRYNGLRSAISRCRYQNYSLLFRSRSAQIHRRFHFHNRCYDFLLSLFGQRGNRKFLQVHQGSRLSCLCKVSELSWDVVKTLVPSAALTSSISYDSCSFPPRGERDRDNSASARRKRT